MKAQMFNLSKTKCQTLQITFSTLTTQTVVSNKQTADIAPLLLVTHNMGSILNVMEKISYISYRYT